MEFSAFERKFAGWFFLTTSNILSMHRHAFARGVRAANGSVYDIPFLQRLGTSDRRNAANSVVHFHILCGNLPSRARSIYERVRKGFMTNLFGLLLPFSDFKVWSSTFIHVWNKSLLKYLGHTPHCEDLSTIIAVFLNYFCLPTSGERGKYSRKAVQA